MLRALLSFIVLHYSDWGVAAYIGRMQGHRVEDYPRGHGSRERQRLFVIIPFDCSALFICLLVSFLLCLFLVLCFCVKGVALFTDTGTVKIHVATEYNCAGLEVYESRNCLNHLAS